MTDPTPPSTTPTITLRQPTTSPTPSSTPALAPPPLAWLRGSWNVTHSTLPMWKKSRNVRITYTPLSTRTGGTAELDDEVSYQALGREKKKVSRVRGVDRAFSTTANTTTSTPASAAPAAQGEEAASLAYTWRGRGWLVIATSKWEILGWGTESATGNEWVVTYFAKTLFTPAGVDFYSRKGQLQQETVQEMKTALEGLGGEVARLAGSVFEVAFDGEREGEV